LEEYESIRLSDYEGLTQLASSKRLGGFSTYILPEYMIRREKKVAKAFVENKSISIEGGDVVFRELWYYCNQCSFGLLRLRITHYKITKHVLYVVTIQYQQFRIQETGLIVKI